MKELRIKVSKLKVMLAFFSAMVFVAISFLLIQTSKYETGFDRLLDKIFSVIGIIFFGPIGIYAFFKLFDNKPGLIINDEGITDNSSAVSAGLIKWENITNVSINEIYGQKFLIIDVNNADQILIKQKFFKKMLMNLNKKYFSSPVQISSNTLKSNFQELYNLIREQLSIHNSI